MVVAILGEYLDTLGLDRAQFSEGELDLFGGVKLGRKIKEVQNVTRRNDAILRGHARGAEAIVFAGREVLKHPGRMKRAKSGGHKCTAGRVGQHFRI